MSSEKKQKTINLLTICIKAGKTVKGFDSVCGELSKNKIYCVICACDASDKTVKEVEFMCCKYNASAVRTDISKEEFGKFFGKQTAVIGICDKGFADGFIKLSNT